MLSGYARDSKGPFRTTEHTWLAALFGTARESSLLATIVGTSLSVCWIEFTTLITVVIVHLMWQNSDTLPQPPCHHPSSSSGHSSSIQAKNPQTSPRTRVV